MTYSDAFVFPDPGSWKSTRTLLHDITRVLSAVPRAFAPPHPRWSQISFKRRETGWWLDPFPLPDGSALEIGIRPADHKAVLKTGGRERNAWDLKDGKNPRMLARLVFSEVARMGMSGLDPDSFPEDSDRVYDVDRVQGYFKLLDATEAIFQKRRREMEGGPGPVQLWPHNFDLAFDWFGSRMIEIVKDGETTIFPAQLNLGWSPGDGEHPEPYFYSNPWPFDPALKTHPLPDGAAWMDGSWQGTILPLRRLAGDPRAEERLLAYAEAVFRLAAPSLNAG